MVKNAAAKSPYDIEKPVTAAATRPSTRQSQQFIRSSADEIIVSLANAYENKRARQVSEWERAQSSRMVRAA